MNKKKCSMCGKTKALKDFYADGNRRCGLRSECKVCKNRMTTNWRLNNRAEYNEYMRNLRRKLK